MDKCGDSEMKSWTGRIRTELFIGLQTTSRECLSVRENNGREIQEVHPHFYLSFCVSLSRYRGKRDLALNPLKGHCLLPVPPKRVFKNLRVWGGEELWKMMLEVTGKPWMSTWTAWSQSHEWQETEVICPKTITQAKGEDRCSVSSDEELCSNTRV